VSHPYEIFGSQDLKDDDGAVIDSFFLETDAPPNPADAPQPITVVSLPEPPKPGRLLSGTQSFTTSFVSPVLVLPADAKRKSITLSVFSTAASPAAQTEYLSVADESGKCGTSAGWTLRHGKDPVTLIDYTGAIWAFAPSSLTAAIELTWVSVTA
jgi:hypothetical protein